MKRFLFALMILLYSMTTFSNQAYGYSYGDPNEEKVAEVYKEMLIKLNSTPPDYTGATEIFHTVKEEIDMHMGKEPGTAVTIHLENEDKEAVIKDMEKILVLNISRRLENIDQNFNDYDTSKKLLAKSFATYKALTPVVEGDNPEVHKKINTSFETALDALGNPGLFGVGEKASDYDKFIASKETILHELKEQFNMKSVEVGHYSEEDFEANESYKNDDWTDISNLKNWIPILLLIGALVAIVIYVRRKRK